jgi:hypothetical protein
MFSQFVLKNFETHACLINICTMISKGMLENVENVFFFFVYQSNFISSLSHCIC